MEEARGATGRRRRRGGARAPHPDHARPGLCGHRTPRPPAPRAPALCGLHFPSCSRRRAGSGREAGAGPPRGEAGEGRLPGPAAGRRAGGGGGGPRCGHVGVHRASWPREPALSVPARPDRSALPGVRQRAVTGDRCVLGPPQTQVGPTADPRVLGAPGDWRAVILGGRGLGGRWGKGSCPLRCLLRQEDRFSPGSFGRLVPSWGIQKERPGAPLWLRGRSPGVGSGQEGPAPQCTHSARRVLAPRSAEVTGLSGAAPEQDCLGPWALGLCPRGCSDSLSGCPSSWVSHPLWARVG